VKLKFKMCKIFVFISFIRSKSVHTLLT
jgi:hypothetical protein